MKALLIIPGVLLAGFAVTQLLGVLGVGPNYAGITFLILGGLGSFLCFRKAFEK